MELVTLLKKYLGESPFIELLPEYLFSAQQTYHVSFYQDVVDQDLIPKSDYEHIDKKLIRLTKLVSSLKKDIRDLDRFMTKYTEVGNLEEDLKFAKGIHTRFQRAQRFYTQHLSAQVADWKSLAKSRALRQEVIATFLIERNQVVSEMTTAGLPNRPIGYGVNHVAVNIKPKFGDLFYYNSHQSMPRMGSGTAHLVKFKEGKLIEVSSYESYVS